MNRSGPTTLKRFTGHRIDKAGAAGVAAAIAILAVAPTDATPAPGDLQQQQVAAIAEAGTVYVSGTWTGHVRYPTSTGSSLSEQISASYSCSGFVASSDGYVVTAGHCADPAEGKRAIVDQFLARTVAAGDLTQQDANQFISEGAENNWPVQGDQAGSPPSLKLQVFPAIAISGTGNNQGYSATVVDDRPLAQGDVALLKADPPSPLPVLQVATAQPSAGDTVDAIGYPGKVTDLVTGSVQPTFAKGQVSGRQQTDGGPFTQVGVSMSPGMSGGPVVNTEGQVIGTVSWGPSGDTQQLNFASTEDNVQAVLSRNSVKNTLTPADQAYRKGLTEFFSGKYHAAADDFSTVLNTQPNHALAQQYKAKAISNFGNEKTDPPILLWVLIGVGVLVVLAAIAVALVLILRRRNKGRRAGPSAPAPMSGPLAQAAVPPGFVAIPAAEMLNHDPQLHHPPQQHGSVDPVAPAPLLERPVPNGTSPEAVAQASGASPSTDPDISVLGATAVMEAPAAEFAAHPGAFCSNCGHRHALDEKFCSNCGHQLGS